MPSIGIGDLARRSSLLFYFDARDLSLVARTGQTITFARTSDNETAFDSAGRIRRIVHSQPAWDWIDTDGDGIPEPHLVLQDTRINRVLHKRDLTNAAWTKSNMTSARTSTGIDGQANSATRLTASAANATCIQSITHASSVARATAAYVRRVTGTGTVQMTQDNGATWTTIALTAAFTRFSIPSQTLANPKPGFRIVTSGDAIDVDWVTCEDGTFPSQTPIGSPVDNAATETRDAATAEAQLLALPQAMSIYVKFVERGTLSTGVTSGLIALGESVNPSVSIESTPGAYAILHRRSSNVISPLGASPSLGQPTEALGLLYPNGSVQMIQSINGGAESAGPQSGANALAAAWNSTKLTIGSRGSGTLGFTAISQVKIAAGVRSMALMRSAA